MTEGQRRCDQADRRIGIRFVAMSLLAAITISACADPGSSTTPTTVANPATSEPGDTSVDFGGSDEDEGADEPDDGAQTASTEPDASSAETPDSQITSGSESTGDEQAVRDVVNGFYDAWITCSTEPTLCDAEATYSSFLLPSGDAFAIWIEQANNWRATNVVVRTPDDSTFENFATIESVDIDSGGESANVDACLRDVRAEYLDLGGELELLADTDDPRDYRLQYKLSNTETGWMITDSVIVENVQLEPGSQGWCAR